jgi:glycosyltransferase involved in cell wall biosynthesis
MLYLCIPSYNEAPTVGLLLWKIRKTFQLFPREYEILLADDGSTDATAEILEPYAKALPLTIVRHAERQGYGRSVEELLRLAVDRTDRPRRDAAILMHADFAHSPEYLPELVKRLEGGADLVVTRATLQGEPRRSARLLRRYAPWLLRGLRVSGLRDIVSGFAAFRLVCLRHAMRAQPGPLLTSDGWVATAELIARVAREARRIDTIDVIERLDLHQRPSRIDPWPLARMLWQEGSRIRIGNHGAADGAQGPTRGAEDQEFEEVTR